MIREEQDLKHLLDQMDAELNELNIGGAIKQAGAAVGKFVTQKIPSFVQKIYNKMAGVVKKIESAWFKFHAAICQLKNNKFALFSPSGNKLTPDLDYMKRVSLGKKQIPKYTEDTDKGEVEGWLQPDGRVAFSIKHRPDGIPLLYLGKSLWKPGIVKAESIEIPEKDKGLVEAMSQTETERYYAQGRKLAMDSFNTEAAVKGIVGSTGEEVPISESVIYISDLSEILDDLASAIEKGYAKAGGRKLSLLMYGPPGVGKSEVIQNFFKKRGFKVALLEIKHVPVEILGGMPVIDIDKKLGGDSPVKMVVSDILPPNNGKGKWVLFLDEFNAGDENQLKAAMNLALTGTIGDNYRLPQNTIVVATGNAGEQDNATAVNALDGPELRRFLYKVRIEYHLGEWLKGYALHDKIIHWNGKNLNTGPILPIILNQLTEWAKEGPEKAFHKILKGHGGEEEYTWMDPSTWAGLDQTMKIRGLNEFDKLPEDKKAKLAEIGKKQFPSAKSDYEAGARAYIWGMQDVLLKKVGARVLGKDSEAVVSEMLSSWINAKHKMVNPIDVMFNYKGVRKQMLGIKGLEKERLLSDIANKITEFKSVKDAENYMKEHGYEYYKSTQGDPIAQIAVNVKKLIEDFDIPAEVVAAHLEALVPSLMEKNQFVADYKAALIQLDSPVIRAAREAYSGSVTKQFNDIADEASKQKLQQLLKAKKTFKPIALAAKRITDPAVRALFVKTETRNFLLNKQDVFSKLKQREEKVAANLLGGRKNKAKVARPARTRRFTKEEMELMEDLEEIGIDTDLSELLKLAGIE